MLALYNAYVAPYLLNALDREDEGQGLVEYALIIAVVSVLIVGALATFRGAIEGTFTDIAGSL